MPLYEYYCPHCDVKFEMLRPFSKADAPAMCPTCKGEDTRRAISVVAAFIRSADGSTHAVGGSGGCAGCASGACGSCNHHH